MVFVVKITALKFSPFFTGISQIHVLTFTLTLTSHVDPILPTAWIDLSAPLLLSHTTYRQDLTTAPFDSSRPWLWAVEDSKNLGDLQESPRRAILVDCRPLSCIKITRTWRCSDVICGQPMVGTKFEMACGMYNWLTERYCKVWVDSFISLADTYKEETGGAKKAPLPIVARDKKIKQRQIEE